MIRVFLAVILIFPFISGCRGESPRKEEILLMDTFVRIQIADNMEKARRELVIGRVIERMKKLEKKFDYFSEDSELTFINNLRKGDKFRVSPEMFELLKKARKMHIRTKGAFDITKGLDNWRLDRQEGLVWFRKDGIKIDLGGIAKGFIVDEGIRLLRELGVTNALINAGGDMYCMGPGPRGRGWKVGIRNPMNPRDVVEILRMRDKGVATSGGYERFRVSNGEKVSHIIDPKTGKPVKDIFKSVTVVAPDCATADALATGLYVLEPQKALFLIQGIDGADCIIVDRFGFMYVSSGLPQEA